VLGFGEFPQYLVATASPMGYIRDE
jgi:hypothetical protein